MNSPTLVSIFFMYLFCFQIFVAVLCTCFTWQQVAAVVNNNPLKDESVNSTPDNTNPNQSTETGEVVADSVGAAIEEKSNRREAALVDNYGAPQVDIALPVIDSYLPSEPSNPNLPIPVYGVPITSSNNVVYPEPPPDIPPPKHVPSLAYGLPHINNYGQPFKNNFALPNSIFFGSPGNNYGAPNNNYGPPVRQFSRKPFYGPPRLQYGPPGKPLNNVKFGSKQPYKNFGPKYQSKPFTTYGPPVGYFKDNYSPVKFNTNFNGGNIISHGGSLGGVNTKYGPPNLAVNLDFSGVNGNNQHGVSNFGFSSHGSVNSVSTEYGTPDSDILSSLKPHYGPPQPSPHPRPPHPGAPAPPTPPDIKYDGWQPIPGLVSRKPTSVYGAPHVEQHIENEFSYNKDLSPPPVESHNEPQSNIHTSVANLELENSYSSVSQNGVSDSYKAPLNTVTGSGGVVIASGEEAHANKDHSHEHQNNVNIGLSAIGLNGQNINTVKSIGYEIFPSGAATISGEQTSSYGAPAISSHSSNSYSDTANLGQISGSYGPPTSSIQHSGSYEAPVTSGQSHPSGSYGTPLQSTNSLATTHSFTGASFGSSHIKSSFNSQKNHGYKGLSLSNSGIGLIPPSGVYGGPSGSYGTPLFSGPKPGHSKYHIPPPPSNLYGAPHSHSTASFQNINHGYTSYNAPSNFVNQQQVAQSHSVNDIISLDYSYPGVTLDLTQGSGQINYNTPHDCKQQSLPSLSYGVPSANSYTAALSSLTTNIESKPHDTYGVPDLTASHSQKINTEVKTNSIETQAEDIQGKSYGKTLAASFGPNSELVQSQSIDFNNISLQGALGSYTLQIQSADGGQSPVPHGQVLNDGLLQSILAAIEQPKGSNSGQPIIQLQKSLEQQQFVTNDTISSVVEQLTDEEIRQGTQLAKEDIVKTSQFDEEINKIPSVRDIKDSEIQYSFSNKYLVTATNPMQNQRQTTNIETNDVSPGESDIPILENNGIALYFSNTQRLKKETEGEGNHGLQNIEDKSGQHGE
ncbi:uncharacterized protein LOC130451079 [Diorhabda sublineata]|uniref:uncharacterized protein LOC130451079 n=1 Tax=Diorhabda sublineata TaxID=1163346 RepID=UPI0024E17C81|nr:uncharacterized protein LOC130451079 [Diorhabda sublineata]